MLDMCCFGLKVKTATGEKLVRKPTTLLTNSKIMADCLSKKCNGAHVHCQLKGGTLTAQAAVYSKEFCMAIVSAYKRHCHKHGENIAKWEALLRVIFKTHAPTPCRLAPMTLMIYQI